MDLDFNPPGRESFFSPNHQPHSLSTIWDDKNKEEEADPSTSDMDERSSYQEKEEDAETAHENNNINEDNNMHDFLEWENGIGTLAGSDLKFRMGKNGDIEVITDVVEMGEDKSNKNLEIPIAEKREIFDESCNKFENGNSDIKNESSKKNKNLEVKDVKSEYTINETYEVVNDTKEDSDVATNSEKLISDEGQDFLNENVSIPKKSDDEEISLNSFDDNLIIDDPVLKEDAAAMMFENGADASIQSNENNCDFFQPEVPEESPYTPKPDTIGKCEICGKPARLANRFCSRQCLGRNAAMQRRANNMLSTNGKKMKYGKRKHSARNSISPHSNDVLTVVHDESMKNDLKIKIRWSSASTDNQDEYFPDSRESAKRRYTSVGSNEGAETRKGRQKKFSWASYIETEKSVASTPETFDSISKKDVTQIKNKFKPGMALEGVDPEHESLICSLFVAETRGLRIRLSFCGYSEAYDFWRDVDSPLIFPCGFCKETARSLEPPKGSQMKFDWEEYMRNNGLYYAPEEYFIETEVDHLTGFEIGQKFEAVDKHNPDLVCVATVQDVINSHVLVHFDGWSHDYDYWCSFNSQYIHHIGWCKENEKYLTPPEGYTSPEKFDWYTYLSDTNSCGVNEKSFSIQKDHKFVERMKLEAVDPRNKQLIRVATISEINYFKVKIHFDGWSDMYDFWTNLENTDLHPVGWCKDTDHPLEPPIFLDDVDSWQTGSCPIPGCTGVGHIQGAKFRNHYSEFGCPYSPQNLTKDLIKDRLAVRKPRRSRSVVINEEERYIDDQSEFDYTESQRRSSPKGITRKRNSAQFQNATMTIPDKRRTSLNYEDFPASNETVGTTADVVSKWTVEDVVRFIDELTSQPMYGKIFKREEIDGEAIMMLTQSDILQILKIKLGPAVKIYKAITLIKEA